MRGPVGPRTPADGPPGRSPGDPAPPSHADPAEPPADGSAPPGAPASPGPRSPARLRPRLDSPWWRGAAALAAGALPALAFPAPALWWWAYAALVPWLLLLRSAPTWRRAALDGWLGGTGFMLAVHHWLMPSLHVFIVVLAALLGLLWAPWGGLVRYALRGAPSPGRAVVALAVVPCGWLVVELARSWEGLGGPWGLLGASQWQVPPALRLASLGGVWLVSLLVVAANTALTLAMAVPSARTTGVAGVVVCAATMGAAFWWVSPPPETGRVRIAVVQPGVVDGPEPRFDRGEALTRQLAGKGVDLVVWGESSVGSDLGARADLAARLGAVSRQVGAPLLVNVDARRSDRPGIFKSSVLIGADGPTGDRYDKMRLVPFGEYVPARSLLGWATSVGKAAGEDRRRGTSPVVMALPGEAPLRVGPLVCFESAFPDMSRRLARDGAQLLVAQSATSSFQHSWAPEQHASLAALRAAESGRPMVHATLTGVSAVYGPDGARVGGTLGTDESAAAVYEVPLARAATPYVRLGDWAVYLALVVLAALCAVEGVRALRKPAPGPAVPPARTARGSAGRRGR
ncbi:apolipoprotein N-acyltransferase [Streptomyces sp. NPDC001941]|uniref:apolipoprotein N-acyltransferase n=1 Tax=Streptomyces sp. NPDC001941 TaxID=3154659 RepID=UPI003316C05C